MIALYPGAFKPPHKGHFEVVQRLLKGTHNGKVYNISNYDQVGKDVLLGKSDSVQQINKVIVFIGGGERNGITANESKQIWDIYKKYLDNVEVVVGGTNPMMAAKDYAKASPDSSFYAVTGIRS